MSRQDLENGGNFREIDPNDIIVTGVLFHPSQNARPHKDSAENLRKMEDNLKSSPEHLRTVQPSVTRTMLTNEALQAAILESLTNGRIVIMHGPHGLGKTRFAIDVCSFSLIVRCWEDLAHFNPVTHTGIVFVGYSPSHFAWSSHNVSMFSMLKFPEKYRTVPVLNGNVDIPGGTPVVLTTTEAPYQLLAKVADNSPAMTQILVRRCDSYAIRESLF